MKVLLVGPTHPYKGGVAQHTTALAQKLADAGHEVDLLSWQSQYPARLYPGALELDSPESELEFQGTRRELNWYDPTSWIRSVKSSDADVVVFAVVNGFQMPAYAAIANRMRRRGARVVALCHNVIPHDSGKGQQAVIAGFLRSVDCVVVHSQQEVERARAVGVEQIRMARLPFFFPIRPQPLDVNRSRTHRLLALGFVRPYKGIDVLIEADALAETNVEVTVVGEFWTPMAELSDQARSLGVEGAVNLRDEYVEPKEVVDLLQSHDALVLPYRSGAGSQQPRVAHLAGTPVISTRVGDLSAQVNDRVDGYLVEPSRADQLAEAIERLYKPGELRRLRSGIVRPVVITEWAEYLRVLMDSSSSGIPLGGEAGS